MKLTITIHSDRNKIIKELKDIVQSVEEELNDPFCLGCTECKDGRKGCYVGGGTSEKGLESDWKLQRSFNEHKRICKSDYFIFKCHGISNCLAKGRFRRHD